MAAEPVPVPLQPSQPVLPIDWFVRMPTGGTVYARSAG